MADSSASEWAERFLRDMAASAGSAGATWTDEHKTALRSVGALLCHVAQGAIDEGGSAKAVIVTVAGAWSAIANAP